MGSYQFTFNICNSVCGVSLHVGRAPHTAQLVLHTHVLWLHFPTAVVRLWDFVPSEMFAAWYYISCFHHSFKDISLCLNRNCVCCYIVCCVLPPQFFLLTRRVYSIIHATMCGCYVFSFYTTPRATSQNIPQTQTCSFIVWISPNNCLLLTCEVSFKISLSDQFSWFVKSISQVTSL